MVSRIAALALVFVAAVGCDSEDGGSAPAEGSCQALADELLDVENCQIPLGRIDGFDPAEPRDVAECAATNLDLEQPPEVPMVEGLAYQVAYLALCQEHGNTAAGFCDISETLGCEG